MIISKKVKGEIDYNDGEFAEVQTSGIEGIEKDLLLDTFQIHREDSSDSPEEFRQRFPVGLWLDVVTTTEIPRNQTWTISESPSQQPTTHNTVCNSGTSIRYAR
jgi:hypothetical protein